MIEGGLRSCAPVVSMMLEMPARRKSSEMRVATSFSSCRCSSGNTVVFMGATVGVNLNTVRCWSSPGRL